jgi:uncharacterized membrane protein
MGRGLKTALVLSILLNVFLICGVVTAGIMGMRAINNGRLHPPTVMALAARKLDPAEHRKLRDFMEQKFAGIHPDFVAARAARVKAATLAAQPTFDRAGASAQLAVARAAELQGHAKVDEAVLDYMSTMPAEQRAKLAEGFKARPPRAKEDRN